MSKRMLIDARHPEETRVTVLKGNRVDEFDYESATKRQLKGNIYLARVTRVEPSLQAAFVEYGGNRHGFLAFSEIHPDYYQIPAEDRAALLEDMKSSLNDEQDSRPAPSGRAQKEDTGLKRRGRRRTSSAQISDHEPENQTENQEEDQQSSRHGSNSNALDALDDNGVNDHEPNHNDAAPEGFDPTEAKRDNDSDHGDSLEATSLFSDEDQNAQDDPDQPENAGASDELDQAESQQNNERRNAARALKRRYSIQEVIKKRQILLIQVVKEERGNKGAALTTYLSLAGRYCVLMPNATQAGGISRKISSAADRKRLKGVISSLEVPQDMGLIIRTAGTERTKTEIKRDFEYLMRLWNDIRDLTLRSVAPCVIYEEANLIKRTIRDLYMRDIDEILVEGEAGYRQAKDFMKLLMPSHAKKVQHYKDMIPLFHRYQVESALASMYQPIVQLKSGGYVVINPTEALISIDVNSGRSTREHNIEETAFKTNLEAAEEIARQLRLRDMAGLIVIDFIDMEDRRNNQAVERRMKDVLKADRARIQIGRISSFGLMEMSRQRMRPNLLETSMETCPHCSGTGHVQSVEFAALSALRMLEEEGIRERSSTVRLHINPDVAIYLLNKKRTLLVELEMRYHYTIEVLSELGLSQSDMRLSRENQLASDKEEASQTIQAGNMHDSSRSPAQASPDSNRGPERQNYRPDNRSDNRSDDRSDDRTENKSEGQAEPRSDHRHNHRNDNRNNHRNNNRNGHSRYQERPQINPLEESAHDIAQHPQREDHSGRQDRSGREDHSGRQTRRSNFAERAPHEAFAADAQPAHSDEEGGEDNLRKRRRRRRRRGERSSYEQNTVQSEAQNLPAAEANDGSEQPSSHDAEAAQHDEQAESNAERNRRRRGRRGGRGRRPENRTENRAENRTENRVDSRPESSGHPTEKTDRIEAPNKGHHEPSTTPIATSITTGSNVTEADPARPDTARLDTVKSNSADAANAQKAAAPKRRTVRRKKADDISPASESAAKAEAANLPAEAQVEKLAEKPVKTPRPRRAAKAKEAAADDITPSATPRRRKTTAISGEAEPSGEASRAKPRRSSSKTKAEAAPSSKAAPKAEPVKTEPVESAKPEPNSSAPAEAKNPTPAKKGWWQRTFG